MEKIPRVVKEGKIKVTDDLELTVFVLDNGRRVLPEEDMMKALAFIGLDNKEALEEFFDLVEKMEFKNE